MKRLVICSGKVNRLGYRCVPSGVKTENYIKNPVLLGMHYRQMLSIGKMTDIRIEPEGEYAGMLTGLPEFDEGDAIALDYKRKFEKGYMNACSMGHDPIEVSSDPSLILSGQTRQTVVSTELLEISMTNIPGERDAVGLTLSANDGGNLDRLAMLETNINHKNKFEMKSIISALGLEASATETEIVNSIKSLQLQVNSAKDEKVEALMKLGMEKGFITEDNKSDYKKLAYADYDSTVKVIGSIVKEEPAPVQQLSIADQLKGKKEEIKPNEALSYEKLSKENPKELLRIKNEEPEKYQKLCAEYAKDLVEIK